MHCPHSPKPSRNTSGFGFLSTPTSCLYVCCTIHQTMMTPFKPHNPKTWTNFYPLTICDDFNCHHASCLGVGTSLICHGTSEKDFCDSLGLTQSVHFPKRKSTNVTPTLLNLILTNFPENSCCSSSAPIGLSDHVLVKVDISLTVIREPPQHRRV